MHIYTACRCALPPLSTMVPPFLTFSLGSSSYREHCHSPQLLPGPLGWCRGERTPSKTPQASLWCVCLSVGPRAHTCSELGV